MNNRMKDFVDRSMTFGQYIGMIDALLAEGRTTGPDTSSVMADYGRLNRQRMRRLENTTTLEPATIDAAQAATRPVIWLVITEGWCGDAAQSVPVIEKIAAASDVIETRYILRDEHPQLMDMFLTNGARSIPKLIALDAGSFEVIGSWGPRPQPTADLYFKMKERGVVKPLIMENMQRWYNTDRTRSIQSEIIGLIEQNESSRVNSAAAR